MNWLNQQKYLIAKYNGATTKPWLAKITSSALISIYLYITALMFKEGRKGKLAMITENELWMARWSGKIWTEKQRPRTRREKECLNGYFMRQDQNRADLHKTHPPNSVSGVWTIRMHRLTICANGSTPSILPAALALALYSTNFSFWNVFMQYLQCQVPLGIPGKETQSAIDQHKDEYQGTNWCRLQENN